MIVVRQCPRHSTGLQGICHSCRLSSLQRETSTTKRFSDEDDEDDEDDQDDEDEDEDAEGDFNNEEVFRCETISSTCSTVTIVSQGSPSQVPQLTCFGKSGLGNLTWIPHASVLSLLLSINQLDLGNFLWKFPPCLVCCGQEDTS